MKSGSKTLSQSEQTKHKHSLHYQPTSFEIALAQIFDHSYTKLMTFMILVLIFERSLVGLSPYSGSDNAPVYGDFECHRLWMEITYN